MAAGAHLKQNKTVDTFEKAAKLKSSETVVEVATGVIVLYQNFIHL